LFRIKTTVVGFSHLCTSQTFRAEHLSG